MKHKTKRLLSWLLALAMVVSLFAIVPISAGATIYDSGSVDASSLQVGDIITGSAEQVNFSGYTVVLKGGGYATGSPSMGMIDEIYSEDRSIPNGAFDLYAEDGHLFLYDYNDWGEFVPFANNKIVDAVIILAKDGNTITLGGFDTNATFTVTWKNWDGTTLETDANVKLGATPTYNGNTPEKADTYVFSGWSDGTNTYGANDTLPAVTADVTYTAVFETQTKYSVTITPGSNMTKTETSGAASQTGLSGAMTDVVYTANDGYYFPTDYSVTAVNGISVTRNSDTQITVSGTPTADAAITLTAPTAAPGTGTQSDPWKIGKTNAGDVTAYLDGSTLKISGTGAMKDFDSNGNPVPWNDSKASIRTITIGDGVTSIGNGAFSGCAKPAKITIPSSVRSIGDSAFASCNKLNTVTFTPGTADATLAFGQTPFAGTTAKLAYGEGNTVLYDGANLVEAETAMSGLSNKTLTWKAAPEGTRYNPWKIGKTTNDSVIAYLSGSTLTISGTGAMKDFADYNAMPWVGRRNGIQAVTIAAGVTSIGNWAFGGCENLTSVTIPGTVTSIGEDAFDRCMSLTGVALPRGITEIKASTFYGCTKLEDITIPSTVTAIREYAFCQCSGLTSVTIPSSVTAIGDNAFGNCTNLTTVTFTPRTENATLTLGQTPFAGTTAKPAYGVGNTVLYDGDNMVAAETAMSGLSKKTLTWKVRVTGVTLDEETVTLTVDRDAVALTATVAPEDAADKKVKWSTTGGVTLYSDAACTAGNEIGADATSTLTVYAKGISVGSATVTVTSNADSTKSTSCAVTVIEPTAYYDYLPKSADTNAALADKVVKFNGIDWYVIKDDSTAANAGTVTLLAKDPLSASKFDAGTPGGNGGDYGIKNVYSSSTVKGVLDALTAQDGSFANVADVIQSVDLTDVNVTEAKLWLLSVDEASVLPVNIRKCAQASGADGQWFWLRTPESGAPHAAGVNVVSGNIVTSYIVNNVASVRPALKLDLSKVTFDKENNVFTEKHDHDFTPENGTPRWSWHQTGNTWEVTVKYECSCGKATSETAVPATNLDKVENAPAEGKVTFTATDAVGNTDSKTFQMTANITKVNGSEDISGLATGVAYGTQVKLTTAQSCDWKVNGVTVSQNTNYIWVTAKGDMDVEAKTTEHEQAVGSLSLTATPGTTGKVKLIINYALPKGATVHSAILHRGYVNGSNELVSDTQTSFKSKLTKTNGTYTANISLSKNQQYGGWAEVVFTYNGTSYTLNTKIDQGIQAASKG